jgi:hypothetical protein
MLQLAALFTPSLLLAGPSCQTPHAFARATSVLCNEAKDDPFRPAKPPIEPMVINAIQELLGTGDASAAEVASSALKARQADPDYSLTAEDEAMLTRCVLQVGGAAEEIVALLEAAVAATPWVAQFKMTPSYGVGKVSDPYVRACRAECMLAAIVLHVDGREVDFIDEERIEVLRDAAPAENIEAVRKAAKAAIEGL